MGQSSVCYLIWSALKPVKSAGIVGWDLGSLWLWCWLAIITRDHSGIMGLLVMILWEGCTAIDVWLRTWKFRSWNEWICCTILKSAENDKLKFLNLWLNVENETQRLLSLPKEYLFLKTAEQRETLPYQKRKNLQDLSNTLPNVSQFTTSSNSWCVI